VLTVVGTAGHDSIDVAAGAGGLTVRVNGASSGPYAGVTALEVYGLAGSDTITVASAIALPALLDGGDGNDTLSGGGGNDVLLGGAGGDQLQGVAGLGGTQQDRDGLVRLGYPGWESAKKLAPPAGDSRL
jgi:Ca2+-binding RTX toxin-like protein